MQHITFKTRIKRSITRTLKWSSTVSDRVSRTRRKVSWTGEGGSLVQFWCVLNTLKSSVIPSKNVHIPKVNLGSQRLSEIIRKLHSYPIIIQFEPYMEMFSSTFLHSLFIFLFLLIWLTNINKKKKVTIKNRQKTF